MNAADRPGSKAIPTRRSIRIAAGRRTRSGRSHCRRRKHSSRRASIGEPIDDLARTKQSELLAYEALQVTIVGAKFLDAVSMLLVLGQQCGDALADYALLFPERAEMQQAAAAEDRRQEQRKRDGGGSRQHGLFS